MHFKALIILHLLTFTITTGTNILSQSNSNTLSNQTTEKHTAPTPVQYQSHHAPKSIDFESMASHYLQQANSRMQSHSMRLRDLFLTSNRKFNQVDHAPLMNDIQTSYRLFATKLALNLSTIPLRQLKRNDLHRRQVMLLSKLQLLGLDENDYERSMNLLRSMRGFGTNRLVCHYRTDDCTTKVAIMPTVYEVISKTRNLDELEYYWTSWRKEIGEMARMSFFEYLALFRKAASLNGHVTPSRTWHLYYENVDFMREIETAIMDIMPLYREMHAFMRNVLRAKYGSLITDEDTIPQHLIQQVIQHAWKARSIFSPPYPDRKLPDIKHRMDQEIFTPIKINDMAAEFFQSLGLNHLSASFWNMYSRKMSDEEAGPDCKADVFYFPPDVALRYCPKVDFKKFLQMHGHMAELQYSLYRTHLPFGLDREACPGFGSAIGEAAIVSAGTPRHLEKINLIENYTLDSELSMNRLFRMGVHTILSVPQHFVNEKFFVDALDGRIPPNELNCGYWRIQDKYAGVSPPHKRTEKQFDPEYKFYKGLDPSKPNTVKLISEILGYQFYRSLCIESGQYQPGDPEYPLHNCDFFGNEKVGKLIKDMMTLGSTKHWHDVMQIVTKERKLSGKGIVEYYQPLFIWLKEQNKLNGVSVGWDSYLKCISDDN